MIYKVKTMGGEKIPLESENAMIDLLNQANSGKKLVFTKYGVVNVSSIDSITPYKEKMTELGELLKIGRNQEEAILEILGSGINTKKTKHLSP